MDRYGLNTPEAKKIIFFVWLAYIAAFVLLMALSQVLQFESAYFFILFLTFPVVAYKLVQRQKEKFEKDEE